MPKKANSVVRRGLRLVTPLPRGEDVRALQGAVNAELAHRELEWRRIAVDGEFGPRTVNACAFLGWVLGFSGRRLAPIRASEARLGETAQRLLRDPSSRSAAERARERLRRRRVRELRERHSEGPGAAVAYIRAMAEREVHEVGSSNSGPLIDDWQALFGLHGEPWCGCFAGYAAKVEGGSTASTWFPYGPSIIADAVAGRNGVHSVPFEQTEPGDVLVFWGGRHIGTALARPVDGTISSGEGNTSPNSGGSQSEGGCVAVKTRARSDVSCVARVY